MGWRQFPRIHCHRNNRRYDRHGILHCDTFHLIIISDLCDTLLYIRNILHFFKFFIEWFFNQPHFFGFKYSYYSSSQCLGTDVWRSSYTCMLNVSYRVPARSSAL